MIKSATTAHRYVEHDVQQNVADQDGISREIRVKTGKIYHKHEESMKSEAQPRALKARLKGENKTQ